MMKVIAILGDWKNDEPVHVELSVEAKSKVEGVKLMEAALKEAAGYHIESRQTAEGLEIEIFGPNFQGRIVLRADAARLLEYV